ncbi:MAG: hypothetical protein M9894_08425 [Planctomycetes bacterium]|nr:hypothetical protein [Planctomycetota bacterium]
MNVTIIRRCGLVLAALALPVAAAEDPSDAEKRQWAQAAELMRTAEKSLGEYAADVEHSRSYADPYAYDGKYIDEKFTGLAAAEQELEPLKQALAAIEAKFGTDADALEAKVFEAYGKPVDPRAPGFERRLSPDRKKWLDTRTAWPQTFYKKAKRLLEAPPKWRQLAEDFAVKHVRDALTSHERQYAERKYVMEARGQVTNLSKRRPILEKVLGYLPGDPELTQLMKDLDAAIADWEAKTEKLIDATEWLPHVEPFDGDPAAIVAALREHLKRKHDDRDPLAIRIDKDWEVYKHNLIGEPMCYSFRVEAAYPDPEDKKVARVHMLKVYTPEARGVNKGPPFGSVSHLDTYLIRLGNVSQQGGGFLGTLIKLVLGLGCCFVFLAMLGGGGYLVYTQLEKQKAAAVAPGAPPAAPPGAPPSAPPAPPSAPPAPPTG